MGRKRTYFRNTRDVKGFGGDLVFLTARSFRNRGLRISSWSTPPYKKRFYDMHNKEII